MTETRTRSIDLIGFCDIREEKKTLRDVYKSGEKIDGMGKEYEKREC